MANLPQDPVSAPAPPRDRSPAGPGAEPPRSDTPVAPRPAQDPKVVRPQFVDKAASHTPDIKAGPAAAPSPPHGKLTPADAATAAAAQAAGGPAVPRPVAAAPAPAPAPRPQPKVPVAQPGGAPPALPPQSPNFPPLRPPAPAAAPRRRHWALLVSFPLMVLIPTGIWGWYLWNRAEDRYISNVGFSVRREEAASPVEMFGGIFGGSSSGTASDTDILYEFIRSPDLVRRADEALNIRAMFSRAWPHDFLFAFDPSGTIEDLTDYWNRQVRIYYDDSAGIITVQASAFTPEDAKAIADTIFKESEKVVNGLSDQARQDATRNSAAELEKARGVLTEARQAMTAFRVRTRIVDPTVALGAQMSVMTTLQGQLAEAQVALDTLRQNARERDQRVIQANKKVAALQAQIEAERAKFGGESSDGENYAQLMADYERLKVDLEFAEGAHQTARVAYEAALATAQRQTRYLAAHVTPTVAERSQQPDRPWLLGMGAGLAFLLWSILILVYYSVRDRR